MSAAECTSKACSAELSNERTSERATPALYASILGHYYPECRGGGLAVVVAGAMAMAIAAVHSRIKLYGIDTFIS